MGDKLRVALRVRGAGCLRRSFAIRRHAALPSSVPPVRGAPLIQQDTLPEWSKGVDSSSTSASCVGSNPTGVTNSLGRRGAIASCARTRVRKCKPAEGFIRKSKGTSARSAVC